MRNSNKSVCYIRASCTNQAARHGSETHKKIHNESPDPNSLKFSAAVESVEKKLNAFKRELENKNPQKLTSIEITFLREKDELLPMQAIWYAEGFFDHAEVASQ